MRRQSDNDDNDDESELHENVSHNTSYDSDQDPIPNQFISFTNNNLQQTTQQHVSYDSEEIPEQEAIE